MTVGDTTYKNVLVTEDFTTLEPGVLEHKGLRTGGRLDPRGSADRKRRPADRDRGNGTDDV
jgi:hypothetical protein